VTSARLELLLVCLVPAPSTGCWVDSALRDGGARVRRPDITLSAHSRVLLVEKRIEAVANSICKRETAYEKCSRERPQEALMMRPGFLSGLWCGS
jgi:hypothetical protein